MTPRITLRTDLRPGDVGTIVYLHGIIHSAELGFDPTFEAYVAAPLADFVRNPSHRQRLWIAERDGRIVGCIAIVESSAHVAQLRWFLVVPDCRGMGVGGELLKESLAFCEQCGYQKVILWTVSSLAAAARLYVSAGFVKTEEKPGRMWGVDLIEEKYEKTLGASDATASVQRPAQ